MDNWIIWLISMAALSFIGYSFSFNEVREEAPIVVKLTSKNPEAFGKLRREFQNNNPSYDLHFHFSTNQISSHRQSRAIFIQSGGGTISIESNQSKFSVGDIILLRRGETLYSDSLFNALAFHLPKILPSELPSFIRPDWDENITDTPGGCATETNAYRRILLTWKKSVGPYILHSLNAHRVRIMNSFTHYHPKDGGFDEFYLVQMAQPKARILTSTQLEKIQKPTTIQNYEIEGLFQSTSLEVHDLVYLPRGMIHRGLDGVLAQVITLPGFIPGAEIGVDHLVRAINDRLGLGAKDMLPYNKEASSKPIIK